MKNITVQIVNKNNIYYTNEVADLLCERINDIFMIKVVDSVETKVYANKYLVMTIHAMNFLHLMALNDINKQMIEFTEEYKEIIKDLFGNNIQGITLNIKNHNWDLIFNEYYEI